MKFQLKNPALIGALFIAGFIPSISYAACTTLGTTGNTVVSSPTLCASTSSNIWTTGDLQVTSTGVLSTTSGSGLANTVAPTGTLINAGLIETTQLGTTRNSFYLANDATLIQNQSGGIIRNANNGNALTNVSVLGALENAGNITAGNYAVYNSFGTINTLSNATGGTIDGSTTGIRNTYGSIGTITNNGTISSAGEAIYNYATSGATQSINEIVNNGTITGSSVGIHNANATIGTITNLGTISGPGAGIWNDLNGAITRLNNAQSGLAYVGTMPTYYNIIITNSGYGKLDGTGGVSGATTFGISSLSTLRAGTFNGVMIGTGFSFANAGATSTRVTGSVTGYNWTLTYNTGTSAWDLLLAQLAPVITGPSAANTLSIVQQSAAGLATTYNVQAAALQAGLTYDCNTFDKYGLCASIGGRTGYALTAPVGNQQAGLLVVSHRPDDHFRYGAFADQSVNSAMPNGIKQNNSGPMYGIFGYWNHQKDGMGLGASLTTAFSNSNLTITRNNSLASTEAGSGNTEMSGQAIQAQGTYAVQATDRIKAIPYAGLRYYRVATGGYSEGANANVTSPLTYNGMAQEVFAAVGGVGTSVFLAEKLTGTASVGIQQNLNYKMGNYQGTSAISGLESFSVNMPSNINSMATATAGMSYAVKKNEKLGVNVLWQQQAFSATNTITALATYSIGF